MIKQGEGKWRKGRGGRNGEERRRKKRKKKGYKINRLNYSTFKKNIASLITDFVMTLV